MQGMGSKSVGAQCQVGRGNAPILAKLPSAFKRMRSAPTPHLRAATQAPCTRPRATEALSAKDQLRAIAARRLTVALITIVLI